MKDYYLLDSIDRLLLSSLNAFKTSFYSSLGLNNFKFSIPLILGRNNIIMFFGLLNSGL